MKEVKINPISVERIIALYITADKERQYFLGRMSEYREKGNDRMYNSMSARFGEKCAQMAILAQVLGIESEKFRPVDGKLIDYST